MNPTTLIIVPAFNEAGRVGRVLAGIRGTGVRADVLVVDDGSRDATAREARSRGARVVSHPFNLGYGSALLTGYLYACAHGYRRVVQMDADGQHEAESVPVLLEALGRGADVVVGSRYLGTGPCHTTLLRRVGSVVFSSIVTVWTGTRITDPTSGLQAMSARAVELVAHDGFPEDYPDADVLILLARGGMRLAEVPVTMHPRRGGESMHRGARALWYACKMLLTLALLAVRRRSPYRSGRAKPAHIGT